MEIASIVMKRASSLGFITFLNIIISGSESAVIDIMRLSAVPMAMPFSMRADINGMVPAAFEYNGTPIRTATGTVGSSLDRHIL